MLQGRKIFLRMFAGASLGFALALAAVSPTKAYAETADATASVKRQTASAQFAKAEEQRAGLNSKPADKRTLADYKQVVMSYRRVAMITPRATEVPDSLLAVAELYTEMGDRFGRRYYQLAVDSYQFLVHEYPKSLYCQDAILRIAKLQRDQLGDSALASKTYEDFLKRYPRSPRKREVQEALAEIARVRRIRAAANGETTRVTIDLEDSVQFTSKRIANPDRIFFDLQAARLTPEAARTSIHIDGGLLTAVRVAQNQAGVVRVVLDVNGVKDYTASLTGNPPQLLIDLYGNSAATAPVRTAKAKPGRQAASEDSNENATTANRETGPVQSAASKNPPVESSSSSDQPASNGKGAISATMNGAGAGGNPSAAARNSLPGAKKGNPKSVKTASASAKPELIQPTSAPQPTRDGQATLTRTLGLKIGRIVIDPGHGGHDTGTIGATGLMEKDLCLDVALRLGKIIEQRLPGANVVYTRSDDSFVPLEERTNIANQAKADLFISIHANSSRDHAARGIETYYLNLKGSPEAMEVAARENATAQEGVHDLQDLVKRIARTEKIDESKELAEDIQDSLSKRIQKSSRTVRNRGVRKAPFVVLIGADMPSILTEISFLSNPADEQLLKKPEQRQKVAEGLYQGVVSYLQSMNSVTVNLPVKPGVRRPSETAVEQSRNQN